MFLKTLFHTKEGTSMERKIMCWENKQEKIAKYFASNHFHNFKFHNLSKIQKKNIKKYI